MKKHLKKIILLGVLSMVASCTTAPLTGRSQIKLVSDEAIAMEQANSYKAFISDLKSKNMIVNNTTNGKRLNMIGNKMAKAVESYLVTNNMGSYVKNLNWEFNLIKSDEINAFALPGGKVAFYTGILPVLKTDAGIAFVMGHEIGHVIGGHHAEGYSQKLLAGVVSTGVDIVTGGSGGLGSTLANYGLSASLLKGNRTQEYEADKYGMIFMAMAGYDPKEAIEAEKRMEQYSGSAGIDFFSTHPAGHKRIEELEKFLPEAMKYYKK